MKKPILNEEIARLRKIMGLSENFDAPSMDENRFELNGRVVDVSNMNFFPYEQFPGTEYGIEGLFYVDTNEELTPEECEQFKAKYEDFVHQAQTDKADGDYQDMLDKRGEGLYETENGSEEKMVSFDDLISQEDQAAIDAHDEEEANKYVSKNYDDVESGAIDEDWGSSDQSYMNAEIHKDLNEPTEFNFSMYDALKNAAEAAVDNFWSDWEEYNTDREGLVMNAMRRYLRRYFPDWYENMSKMFA